MPLSYSRERVLGQTASVHPYFPLARVQVSAQFVVFNPALGSRVGERSRCRQRPLPPAAARRRPGHSLTPAPAAHPAPPRCRLLPLPPAVGFVTKVSEAYIGLLVLGFMNASVRADCVRADLRYQPAEGCWASTKRPAHRIAAGDSVAFTVAALERHGAYGALTGEMRKKDTGNAVFVAAAAAAKAAPKAIKDKDGAGKKVGKAVGGLAEAPSKARAQAAHAAPEQQQQPAEAPRPAAPAVAGGAPKKRKAGGGGEGAAPADGAVQPKAKKKKKKLAAAS